MDDKITVSLHVADFSVLSVIYTKCVNERTIGR